MELSYNDFKDPIFSKTKRYKRLAREHLAINELKSDRIKWKVLEKETHLKIPVKYEITYLINSIIGINEDQSPIFGKEHKVEITLPPKFPIETFKAKTISKVWHPNIKWDGPMKGRICVNNKGFGAGYNIRDLVLRVGKILQYKNYLAENIPPYPEDAIAAKWVLDYAEPNKIVSYKENIATDDSNLLEYTGEKEPESKIKITGRKKGKINIIRKRKD